MSTEYTVSKDVSPIKKGDPRGRELSKKKDLLSHLRLTKVKQGRK